MEKYGGLEVLQYKDREPPRPQNHEILIRVLASSVNPIDWKLRKGLVKWFVRLSFPVVLGFDFSGIVVEMGDQVDGFLPGYEVYGFSKRGEMGA